MRLKVLLLSNSIELRGGDLIAGSNTKLLMNLAPQLAKEHELAILSPGENERVSCRYEGIPVHFAPMRVKGRLKELCYRILARLKDKNGCSDWIQARLMHDAAKKLRSGGFKFDAVIATMEPFSSAYAASGLKGCQKILYIMDPPAFLVGGAAATRFRRTSLEGILRRFDMIITTPFIKKALAVNGYEKYADKMTAAGFPMIRDSEQSRCESGIAEGMPPMEKDRINVLFCGWLYSDIRSPKYFLDIAKRLDRRFNIIFMGKECEKLGERFDIRTEADITAVGQQPHSTALSAMANADILVNIGNSVPIHMPSKTLEYINTGKPIVNIYKLPDCPTLHYTKKYPLCLNLYEGDADIDAAAERFTTFCIENKGKTAERSGILAAFEECTPKYIAKKMLRNPDERQGKRHG